MFVTLPSNSSITYEVEVTNDSDTEYKMNTLEVLSNNNSNITIESIMTSKVTFEKNSTSKYTITLSNNKSNDENITLVYKYNFVINNYYEEASEKFTLVKNNVSGYEGVYYFDENGDLDYGDGTKIYLNMTDNIPKGVVSIWNNQAIYVCLNYGKYNYEYDTTKSKLEIREMPCLTDRYQNLVINGDLSYKSNYNLTQFGDYNEDGYIYKTISTTEDTSIDDYIPIDTSKSYKLVIDLKSSNTSTIYFAGIMEYDADKKIISPYTILYVDNTLTELAEDLKPGDTVVYLKDLSNWNITTSKNYNKGFIFWGYKDSTDYEYPALSYSQYYHHSLYTDNSSVNKENNTITLSKTWTGNYFKKCTKVSQSSDSATFNYSLVNGKTLTTNWVSYTNENLSGTNSYNSYFGLKFRPGTKYIKLFVRMNYGKNADVTTYSRNFYIQEKQ